MTSKRLGKPGVCIGNKVIASARSYITKDIPDNALVAGLSRKDNKKELFTKIGHKN